MSLELAERTSLAGRIAEAAEPLPNIDDPAFAAAFDRFADARVVLLGEASHGTSEFYRARAAISRRLIERIAPPGREAPATPDKPEKQPVKDTAELNDRLFEKAWRKRV